MAKEKWVGTPIAVFTDIQKLVYLLPRDDQLNTYFSILSESVLNYLNTTSLIPLKSNVLGKEYFAFENDQRHSRSVNLSLFGDNLLVQRFLRRAKKMDFTTISSEDITKACYTIATGFACVVDLLNPGDRQTPGCLFQYLITHLITRKFNTDASERVKIKVGNDTISLTMDLIINPSNGKHKYHVAIKTSTRERASEFWAQQHILNEAFKGEYLGYFFGMAETKLDHTKLEVVEICVPDQWRAYQYYISHITGIYYLDPPNVYLELKHKVGGVVVKPFGDFFLEDVEN